MFRRFVGRDALVRFSREAWSTMFDELGRRAGGRREAGAFLLSPRNGDGRTISHIVYYDDLDPKSLRGDIRLDAAAYARLWDKCDAFGARVVGDIHTHPGSGFVEQSTTDQNNPMVARVGHVAIVVPYLGGRLVSALEVGAHVYRGDAGWRDFYGRDAARVIYVGRFA